eukprot:Nitzschia sp. Nitz4//scaffold40_size135432//70241//71530//NITZ4_003247-RA/size135432-processed-gene-0.41-mRNA-1//1//CDS//3329551228//7101//frame0
MPLLIRALSEMESLRMPIVRCPESDLSTIKSATCDVTRLPWIIYSDSKNLPSTTMNLSAMSKRKSTIGIQSCHTILPLIVISTSMVLATSSGRTFSSSATISQRPSSMSTTTLGRNNLPFVPFSGWLGPMSTACTSHSSWISKLSGATRNFSEDSEASTARLATQLPNYQKVVVLMGAGASVSAGIPDFRTPGTGLYDKLQEYKLPYPEAIFDLDYYRENPGPFVRLAKEIWPGQQNGPKPTLTHSFLRLLELKGMLQRVYSQNIDGLEALAEVSEDKLVECHGHFRSSTCCDCRAKTAIAECYESMVEQGKSPLCPFCGGYVKPDIVFFGEALPGRFHALLEQDVQECDLLLVIGTSLVVMPVAGIPSWVQPNATRVLINRELVGDFAYSNSDNDYFLQGDCDDSIRKLCQLMGWEKELDETHSKSSE